MFISSKFTSKTTFTADKSTFAANKLWSFWWNFTVVMPFFVSFRLWTFLSSLLMKCLILSHVSQRRSSDMSLTQYVSPVYVVFVFVYCATIMCFVVLLLDIWWLVRSTYGYTTRLGQQVANPRTGRWYEIHLQTKTLLQHYTHK